MAVSEALVLEKRSRRDFGFAGGIVAILAVLLVIGLFVSGQTPAFAEHTYGKTTTKF